MLAASHAPQKPPLRTPSSAWGTVCRPLCAVRVTLDGVLLGPGPSLQLRRRLPALVRNLRWYYGPAQLLGGVRAGRAARAFPHRPAAGRQSVAEVSRFSRKEFPDVVQVLRPHRGRPPLALARRTVWPSPAVNKVGTRDELFHGSIVRPASASVNASPAMSPPPAHDSRSTWFTTPSLWGSFLPDSPPVYPGAF